MRHNLPVLLVASITLFIAACATPVSRGHIHEPEAISTIKPGVTSRDEVLQLLGSPSSESSFGLATWYYISSVKEVRSVFTPKVKEQNVTEVVFNNVGVVSSVRNYTLADGKQIDTVSRITPTEGQQLGFFEQIMGNLGRFNKEGKSGAAARRPSAPSGR